MPPAPAGQAPGPLVCAMDADDFSSPADCQSIAGSLGGDSLGGDSASAAFSGSPDSRSQEDEEEWTKPDLMATMRSDSSKGSPPRPAGSSRAAAPTSRWAARPGMGDTEYPLPSTHKPTKKQQKEQIGKGWNPKNLPAVPLSGLVIYTSLGGWPRIQGFLSRSVLLTSTLYLPP